MENKISEKLINWQMRNYPEISLKVFLQEDLGVGSEGFREKIRKAIGQKIVEHAGEFRFTKDRLSKELRALSLENLNQPPRGKHIDVSISHCPGMGGFALSHRTAVGLDVEQSKRITQTIANRIKSDEETLLGPSCDAFWVAKESAFKACKGVRQPKTLSGINVNNWEVLSEGVFQFEFMQQGKKDSIGTGVVLNAGKYVVGLALVR